MAENRKRVSRQQECEATQRGELAKRMRSLVPDVNNTSPLDILVPKIKIECDTKHFEMLPIKGEKDQADDDVSMQYRSTDVGTRPVTNQIKSETGQCPSIGGVNVNHPIKYEIDAVAGGECTKTSVEVEVETEASSSIDTCKQDVPETVNVDSSHPVSRRSPGTVFLGDSIPEMSDAALMEYIPEDSTKHKDEPLEDNKAVSDFKEVFSIYWNKFAKSRSSWNDPSILNSRLVCSKWKTGIDVVLESDRSAGVRKPKRVTSGDLALLQHPQNQLGIFQPVGLNMELPKISWKSGALKYYRDSIDCHIKEFGHGLKSFGLTDFQINYKSQSDHFLKLSSWILLMPNLQELKLYQYPASKSTFAENDPKTDLAANPFPKLEKLINLVAYGIQTPMLQAILEANNHITRFSTEPPLCLEAFVLPELVTLRISVTEEDLFSLINVKCIQAASLAQLSIEAHCPGNSVYFRHTFGILEHFKQTLKLIVLFLPGYICKYAPCPVAIPCLEEAIIYLDQQFCSASGDEMMTWNDERILEFSSSMTTLRKLYLRNYVIDGLAWFVKYNGVEQIRKMDIRNDLRNHLVSVLWELHQFLKTVEIVVSCKSRRNLDEAKFVYIRRTGYCRN